MQLVIIILFFIFTILGIPSAFSVERIELLAPPFAEAEFIDYGVGIRPCRKGGIRLELQNFGGKKLLHNYGHGGSGISLSWGCAEVAVELLQPLFLCKKPSVALLGSGVIGLTTAHALLDRGYEVTIYAATFPPYTTSNIGVGIWDPCFLVEEDPLLERLNALSYARFRELAESKDPEFQGVSWIDVYSFGITEKRKQQLPNPKEVEVLFNKQTVHQGMHWKTFRIEGDIYLQALLEKAVEKGACFEKRFFYSQDELFKLEEQVIINCTGYGSKVLFGDNQLIPVRGQLLYFSPQKNINYVLGCIGNPETYFFFVPWKSKLILGGTYEVGEEACCIDVERCRKIWDNAINFLHHSTQPNSTPFEEELLSSEETPRSCFGFEVAKRN